MEQAAGGGAARARPIAGGGGIHWPDLDEEISVEGESLGRPPVGGPGDGTFLVVCRASPGDNRAAIMAEITVARPLRLPSPHACGDVFRISNGTHKNEQTRPQTTITKRTHWANIQLK